MADDTSNSDDRALRDRSVPDSGTLSAADIDRQLDELSIDVQPLPDDFSRADIYLDHD
jgi:hypothetical protein